jgi:hypothetical protein
MRNGECAIVKKCGMRNGECGLRPKLGPGGASLRAGNPAGLQAGVEPGPAGMWNHHNAECGVRNEHQKQKRTRVRRYALECEMNMKGKGVREYESTNVRGYEGGRRIR